MREFILNQNRPDNYMFIAKDAGLYLDVSCRRGVADEITPDIKRGLYSGVIIDITKDTSPPPKPPEVVDPPPKPPEVVDPAPDSGDTETQPDGEVTPSKKGKKSGK